MTCGWNAVWRQEQYYPGDLYLDVENKFVRESLKTQYEPEASVR